MLLRSAVTKPIANLLLAVALAIGTLMALQPSSAEAAVTTSVIMPMYNGCARPDRIPEEVRRYAREQNITLCQGERGNRSLGKIQPYGTVSDDCGWTGITLGSAGGGVAYFNLDVHSYLGGISRLSWQTPYRVDWGPIQSHLSGGAWVWSSDWQYSFTEGTGSGTVWAQLNGWAIVGWLGTYCYFGGATDTRYIY